MSKNSKNYEKGFYQLQANRRRKTTATAIISATTSEDHHIRRHIPALNKCNTKNTKNKNKNTNKYCNFSKSICNMKYKNNKNKNSNSGGGSNSSTRCFTASIKYLQSLNLFYCSCFNSPSNCIVSFITATTTTTITTTIYCCMQYTRNCWWWWWWSWCFRWCTMQQQYLQKQYKIKSKTLNNSIGDGGNGGGDGGSTIASSSALASASKTSLSAIVKQRKEKKMLNFCTSLQWYSFLWLFLSILAVPCTSLSMTEVRIPKHIMRYESAALGCKYDLDGESLYSVKWYKDGFEFYRYVPRDKPPGQVFPLPGVDVDLQNSTDNVVVLNRVTLQSTGRYRCEVSGEAPSFQTVSGHEDMIVVVTPSKGPQITGGQPRYSIGEKVSVNCTSAPSKPICHLSWLINGVHANRSYLRYYEPKIVGREGLEVATLGLEFRVRG